MDDYEINYNNIAQAEALYYYLGLSFDVDDAKETLFKQRTVYAEQNVITIAEELEGIFKYG